MSQKEKKPREYRGVRDEIREQQLKTKDMSLKGKLKYFWGYYKFHVIITLFVLFLLVTLIHDISTAKDYSFYAIVSNSSQLSDDNMAASFTEYAGLDTEEHECIIDADFNLSLHSYSQYDMAASQKLFALVQAGELDSVIMEPAVFYNYSLSEMFVDLRTIFTEEELSKYKDSLYYIDYVEVELANEDSEYEEGADSPNYDPDADTTESILAEAETHRHPENMEKPVPVGVFLTDSPFALKTGSYPQTVPIFGIISTSQKIDTCKKFLEFLWDENTDFSQMIKTELY